MLILVTNRCSISCKHCMQNASPKNNSFMSYETFSKALDVAKELGANVINIAGGEPTILGCDMLRDFLSMSLSAGFITILETNGHFLESEQKIKMLTEIARKNDNFMIQVSAFKEYYTNRDFVLNALENDRHAMELQSVMKGHLSVTDESNTHLSLMALGRCSRGSMLEKAMEFDRFPSCINPALIAQQNDLMGKPCRLFERFSRFCSPMVDPRGGVHLGESIFCKELCNISDGIERVRKEIQEYKPCGRCHNYKSHFTNPTTGMEKKVYNIIK